MTPTQSSALFDFADQLGLISHEVLLFRIKKKATLSPEEKSQLENMEIELDRAKNKIRAQGIESLGMVTAADRLEVETATKDAEILLRRIRKIKRALNVASSILNLAIAVLAGKPQGILTALNSLKDEIAGDNT